jgi:hypothetical protein
MGQKTLKFLHKKNPVATYLSRWVTNICLLFSMFSLFVYFVWRFKVFKVSKVKFFINSWKSKIFHLRLSKHNDDIKIWWFSFIQMLVIETHTNHILLFQICFVSFIHRYNMNIHPQKNLDLEVLINGEIVWTMNLMWLFEAKKNDQQFFLVLDSQMDNKFAKKSLSMMAKKMIEFGEK